MVKFLKKVCVFILGLILVNCISAIMMSYTMEQIIQKDLITSLFKQTALPSITSSIGMSEEESKAMEELMDDEKVNEVINGILNNSWSPVWADNIDVDNHSFEVCDVEYLSDLEKIKETFSKWTISNYEEIKNGLLEKEKSNEIYNERKEKEVLFNSIIDKISLDDLKKLVNDYTK